MSATTSPFAKVLIANRGEIACRIIRTLRAMGIASVAVHHDSEGRPRHAEMADEAFALDGASPIAAYLDGTTIIEIARKAGAQAIHPGYGFLSENAAFAQAVVDAGLVFIGPEPETIALMGDKLRARSFAAEHGVPVAPSMPFDGEPEILMAQARAIGFPLLVKAAAGGGGKGMSIVRAADDLIEAARIAASEAERYFSDARVYIERYVERPRHIEVQVLGDGRDGVVHLFERECSVQRRFQKIVEEAPASNLAPALRERICEAATRLAGAARYRNAGTVEFILAPDGAFYFLEMNTRLQVEHPVTEMITGIDIVQRQIEIAAGEAPALRQSDIVASGHAIECRICAEDPERDFMPETGKVLALEAPGGADVRFESGLALGQSIDTRFDSLLAKLVVHARDRARAIDRMGSALADLVLLGVGTNVDYLARLTAHPAFVRGDLHTGFVTERADALAAAPSDEATDLAAIAAALRLPAFRDLAFAIPDLHAAMGGWRN